MTTPRRLVLLLAIASLLGRAFATTPAPTLPAPPADEVFYQIFVRSFRDSNGDGKGDLKGIEDKLGYLQELGVTTLLLTPLCASPFYHNYFADDFLQIDPAFGTEREFRQMVRAIHQRGMKIFLDEEMQYVTGNHEWFRDSFNRPESKYSRYLYYEGTGNAKYETGFWESPDVPTYDGRRVRIATVNLLEPAVLKEQTGLFAHWMNPTGAGTDDGVDGFRIDHMQDDLDNHGKLVDLFARFWTPLFRELKSTKPDLRILAEQADWGYGDDWLERGQADMVFAFPLRKAIVSFDKKQLTAAITETAQKTRAGKQQVVFIENHDTDRFTSETGGDLRKAKVGAVLNLLLQGIPLIYYGQELGMTGKQIPNTPSDGGAIPVREAFPWTAKMSPGMAVWYKDSGPWWDQSPLLKGGGTSLEAQWAKPESLLSYYQKLLAIRRANPEFINGDQEIVGNDSDQVFSFVRFSGTRRILVVVNLTETPVTVHLNQDTTLPLAPAGALHDLLGNGPVPVTNQGRLSLSLAGYGVGVYTAHPGQ